MGANFGVWGLFSNLFNDNIQLQIHGSKFSQILTLLLYLTAKQVNNAKCMGLLSCTM